MNWWKWLVLVVLAALTALVLTAITASPMTYQDLAAERTRECVRNKGEGAWRGSSGITLEAYCQRRANVEAMDRLCREHPEKC